MILEIFNKNTRVRVDVIRSYSYVYYEDDITGNGSFEIRLPVKDKSLTWLYDYGNWILFDIGILGIVKGVKDSEDDNTEITVYGYLSNHILEFRSFLTTSKYYDTPPKIALKMFDELFVHPDDERREIGFLEASEGVPEWTDKIRYQSTGKTYLETIQEMFAPYNLGFELYPVIKNYDEDTGQLTNVDKFEFRILKPVDRTYNNPDGNVPVVFSFDNNNLRSLLYEEDGRAFTSVAIVASEGVGSERKTIEVQNTEEEYTGYERIELYVDARDLQSDSGEEQITDEELEELMVERGKEKLQDHQKFITFDASILEGKYQYGKDFYKGDYVSVVDKNTNRIFNIQVTGSRKTYSNGVEYRDLTIGVDRMNIYKIQEKRLLSLIQS